MTVPLIDLGDDVKQLFTDGIDTIILLVGKPCKIVLDGARTQCPNCTFDSVQQKSNGVYNGTGPVAFDRPPCPVCRGTGYDPATSEKAEIRTFTVKRDIKPSEIFPPGILERPTGIARIKGYAKDIPLLLAMKYIVLDYVNATYLNEKYIQLKEPSLTGSVVSGRYFQMYLQRSK